MGACYGLVANSKGELRPWSEIWYKGVPLKVQFIKWTVVMERIFTMDLLWKKGFHLANICLLCYNEAKSASHLLINCPFPWEIRCGVVRDFGMIFIAPGDLKGLLQSWRTSKLNCFGKRIWILVSTAICWAVWLERNNRAFNCDSEPAWQVYKRAKNLIIF